MRRAAKKRKRKVPPGLEQHRARGVVSRFKNEASEPIEEKTGRNGNTLRD